MPYHESRQQYCSQCGKMVRARRISPTMIKCTECGHRLKMKERDYIDIVTGTFGAHRRI